jgi:prevent-host-death family protein
MSAVKMEATKVRRHFAEEMSKVAFGKQRLVIERNGKPLVAVVPMEEFVLLEEYIEQLEDRLDLEAYKHAKAEMLRTGEKPVSWQQFKREHGLTIRTNRTRPRRLIRRAKK